jgi:hypothetical protein
MSVGQLGEGHASKLFLARELLNLVVASVSLDTPTELTPRKEVHDLGKDGSA